MSKVVGIIQGRLGSSRFPGKTLETIAGKPILEFLICRLRNCTELDEIVLATTDSPIDDPLVNWARCQNISCFRGSETDVLDRYFKTAEKFKAQVVVRITADDPLKDPEVIDYAIRVFKQSEHFDYVSNTINPTFPEGIDIEVFSFSALGKAAKEATLQSEREHVTPYIWKNEKMFSCFNFVAPENDSDIRLTVDYPIDLQVMNLLNEVIEDFQNSAYKDVVRVLRARSDLRSLQQGIHRNEGYSLSIEKEQYCGE